jgi:hypothetical protein
MESTVKYHALLLMAMMAQVLVTGCGNIASSPSMHVNIQDKNVYLSYFLSANRKAVVFHLENRSGADATCDMSVEADYIDGTDGAVIGRRTVYLSGQLVPKNRLDLMQEAGAEHIVALQQIYADPKISGFGAATLKCALTTSADPTVEGWGLIYASGSGSVFKEISTDKEWSRGETAPRKRVWSEAQQFCDGLMWNGRSDWRLPTKDELIGAANRNMWYLHGPGNSLDIPNEMLDPFTSSYFWSSTTPGSGEHWFVQLYNSTSTRAGDSSNLHVLCVRDNRLTVNGWMATYMGRNGSIFKEPSASREWTRGEPTPARRVWQEAMDFCDNLDFGGKSDWHLSDRAELTAAMNHGIWQVKGGAQALVTPQEASFAHSPYFWTSELLPQTNEWQSAWFVTLSNGEIDPANTTATFMTLCVRNTIP